MRDNHVLIYNGLEWQLRERDDILQDIVYNKTDILSDKFEELLNQLDEFTIKKFRRSAFARERFTRLRRRATIFRKER